MKLFLVTFMLLPALNCGFLMPSDTTCNAMNNSTCTVTVGGNVNLQIMNNASGYRIQFSKGSQEMFKIKKGTLMIQENTFRNRTKVLMDDRTTEIIIQNVQREDEGLYKVEIYYSNGRYLKTVLVTLEVKGNPWPIVVIACASVGAFLIIALVACCICRKVKRRKHKTNASKHKTKQ